MCVGVYYILFRIVSLTAFCDRI